MSSFHINNPISTLCRKVLTIKFPLQYRPAGPVDDHKNQDIWPINTQNKKKSSKVWKISKLGKTRKNIHISKKKREKKISESIKISKVEKK